MLLSSPSFSGIEDKNVKSLQTVGQTRYNRRSEKLSWAFSLCELKTHHLLFDNYMVRIYNTLSPLHPRMPCAKFGQNWSSGSWEEDENVKSLQKLSNKSSGKTCIACQLFSFKYSKSRQTGSGHAADSKCITRYNSPYWCSVANIRKLASVVPEKNVTEIILWANLHMSTIFKVGSNRKWACRRFKTV